ncbi:MAG: hypothetical protein P8R42_06040 [Candidatus Binatia bacterium]|nr:hypothetical protein [Candidatus Binatia bacterium]
MGITEILGRFALGLLVVLGSVGVSAAHEVQRTAVRELVRLQGYVRPAKDAEAKDVIELSVNGRALPFVVGDRQVFITVGAASRPATKEPTRVVVQGMRELLSRILHATPEQRVTLLGERRPGSAELFLAAVDLCPEAVAP